MPGSRVLMAELRAAVLACLAARRCTLFVIPTFGVHTQRDRGLEAILQKIEARMRADRAGWDHA